MGARTPRRRRVDSLPRPNFDLLELSEYGRQAVLACFDMQAERDGKTLTWADPADWDRFRIIRLRYFNGLFIELDTIEPGNPDPIMASAPRLRAACTQLIAAVEAKENDASLWQLLAHGHPEFERERLGTFARDLRERVESLDHAMKHRRGDVVPGTARSKLIARLAAMFRDKGLKPTAGNSYREVAGGTAPFVGEAPPSPFVALLLVTMGSMPQQLVENISSPSLGAFSKAVSRELRLKPKE